MCSNIVTVAFLYLSPKIFKKEISILQAEVHSKSFGSGQSLDYASIIVTFNFQCSVKVSTPNKIIKTFDVSKPDIKLWPPK